MKKYEIHLTETDLSKINILSLENDNIINRLVKRVLLGQKYNLTLTSSTNEAENILIKNNFQIIIVSDEFIDFSKQIITLNKIKNPIKVILLTKDNPEKVAKLYLNHPHLSSVISIKNNKEQLIKQIHNTVHKLITSNIFGVENFLLKNTKVIEHPLIRSDKRKESQEKMTSYFAKIGIRKTVLERCQTVAEEMIMNAIYDAPVDHTGSPLFNHLDRKNLITLNKEQQGCFRYGCDGILTALSVEDPFGQLSKDTLVEYIDNCSSQEEFSLNQNNDRKAGGGMGIYMMIETADYTLFNIHEGKRTEVISLFFVDKKPPPELNQSSFNLFYL